MNTLKTAFRLSDSSARSWAIAISIIALALLGWRSVASSSLMAAAIPVSQNFDGMSNTSATATLPADFKVDKQTSVRTLGSFALAGTATERIDGASVSSSAANGIYNFGSGTTDNASDRAVGWLSSSSATKSGNLYVELVNNTGGSLSSLTISYDVEKYRNGSNAAGFSVQMYYSTDGANWTSAGANFLTSFPADANNNGFATAPGSTVSVTSQTLSQTIANGANFYLAWNYSVTSGTTTSNAQALAIDNILIQSSGVTETLTLSCAPTTFAEDAGAMASNCTVTRSGPTTSALMVNLMSSDTTEATTPASVTIPIGQASASFDVAAVTDGIVDGSQNVTITASATNFTSGTAMLTVTNVDIPPLALIHDIQGAGETPNFAGQARKIEGIVVGDFQGSSNLSGFFVQEEDADADSDPATSEGIFVFDPSTLVNVNVGDKVTVSGTVTNFGGPPGLTELTSLISVVVNSSGNPLPAAATVSLPVATSPAADLERFEGMRVTFNQTLFVTANEDLGAFGELTLSANSPLYIPTNSIDPNDNPASGNSTSGSSNVAAITAQQTANNNNRITLNDGKTGSNPNPIPFIGAGTNATIRRGDSVANLSGILNFGFGVYRVEPTTLPLSFTAANPRPASPGAVGGSLRVASFNVENYFLTTNPSSGYRGPNNATEQTRKRDKVIAALAGLNADVIGLIELEKATTNGSAAADLAAGLTTAMGGGANTYAAISDPATLIGTDPDIKNGIIYRTSAVTPVGGVLTDTAAAPGTYSRDPISQTFQKNSTSDKFSIVVSHFRSKGCGGSSGADADQGDGQACYNDRRRNQALATLTFIANTLIPIDPDVLVVGDYNSYGQEDPIDVFRAAGYSDVLAQYVAAPSQYSFTFNGEVGRLDHVFATSGLSAQITGAAIWHINADEPDVFDYNTENKPDDRYAATPFRSADHDPVVIGLNLFTPVTISGQKFDDLNGNGAKDSGEPGLDGVTINLDKDANGSVDATTTTSGGGNYSFTVTSAGAYRIREVVPAGYVQTTANPADIVAQSGVNVSSVDFGDFKLISISGQKFDDLNGNGVKDGGEPGLPGVTITLDIGANASVDATTTTNGSGNYSFANLGPGVYRIREVIPAGRIQTTANPADITASSGANVSGVDFGNFNCAGITVNPATIPGAFKGSPYSQAFTQTSAAPVTWSLTGSLPAGLNFNAATATLSGTPAVTGVFNFTVRATFATGCFGERAYALAVNAVGGSIGDPAVCNGPGGVVKVTATVTNNGAASQPSSFTATLDSTLLALPGTCAANAGSCSVVNASTVTWAGTLNAGQTVTITYLAQIADGVPAGTEVCVNSTATVGGSVVGGVKACTTVNCQAIGPGAAPQAASPVSDQKAGSVLIYNVYTSSASAPNTQNTRISLTNVDQSRAAYVHLFFVDGSNCSVADSYICLTANQTTSFLASDLDPGTTGYIVAVAVDRQGCPINFNYLIGDEYVKFSSGHAANLGAEAISAIAGGLPACNENSVTAALAFDGVSYNAVPRALALDNIPSRVDGNDTLLVLNRIGGSLATGAATLTNIFGIFYDDAETGVSFTFNPGVCQFRSSVSGAFPRITPRFETFVPAGRSGWLKLYSTNDQGILGAALNFNANAEANAGAFNQGHNLHKLTLTTSASYTIPIFPPSC